jgi:alanyl-tRNA synthetase
MTERLYYADPYKREFDATVAAIESRGTETLVRLDRTAFYPSSGGQPFDTGTLAAHRVVDVFDADDGEVVHVVDRVPSFRVGDAVRGAIDWPRRFDHMQQHTGQHVLSAALERAAKVRTVSFHLGVEGSTIDLEREVSSSELASAEDEANRIVWEDRPVTISFAAAEEAAKLPLRKEPVRGGTLRLIDVDGFDLSACGGTHVGRTGAIGIIAVVRAERFKGGHRLEFVCGGRALRRFRTLRDVADGAARLLSSPVDGLPQAVEHLQADAKELRRAASAQLMELARYRADELAAAAAASGGRRVVVSAVDGDATQLKTIASAIAGRSGFVVVLVSAGSPSLVVAARSADVDLAADAVLRQLTAKFGGRGGGKPDLAQGGGLSGTPREILDAARAILG